MILGTPIRARDETEHNNQGRTPWRQGKSR